MKKLYDKSELLFAIACIVLYTVLCGNLRSYGDDKPYMTIGLLAISVCLFLFVRNNNLREKYGLAGWPSNNKAMLWFIPLWIIASGNLWGIIAPDYQGSGLLFAAVSMALVGFVEELIFRGFLFKAMLKENSVTTAIVISSVTFGIGHIVNLFTGHALFETLVQICFAIALGFLFTMVYYKSGSLLPGILAHSLIDVFSVFSTDLGNIFDWIGLIVIMVIAIAYSIYLTHVETPAVSMVERQNA